MESASSIGFDLDHLMESYKDFYDQQKRKVYHGTTTTNDSLYIQVLFEKLVNDANKMFISFSADKRYETNGYDKSGNMTEKNETGTYFFEKSKNVIYTYPNGNKNRAGKFKITFLDKTKLVIVFNQSSRPAVFTCRRISE